MPATGFCQPVCGSFVWEKHGVYAYLDHRCGAGTSTTISKCRLSLSQHIEWILYGELFLITVFTSAAEALQTSYQVHFNW